jgi:hypothetical protein
MDEKLDEARAEASQGFAMLKPCSFRQASCLAHGRSFA